MTIIDFHTHVFPDDLAWLDSMDLSSREKDDILYKNALNLLGEIPS